jgi:hypothetical protein
MALNFSQINHNDTTYNGDYYQYWVQSGRDRNIHILNIPTIFQNADCDMECVINDFIEINDLNIKMEEWGQLIGGIIEYTKLKIPEKSSEEDSDDEEDDESDDEEEVKCICEICFGEGKCYVSKERARELERLEEMENECPYGDKCEGKCYTSKERARELNRLEEYQSMGYEVECICGLCPMDNLYVSKERGFKLEDMATHQNECPLSLGLGLEEENMGVECLWDELIQEQHQREQNPN